MLVCADDFLAMVTEVVFHGVHKVVTQSSFCVTGKVCRGKWTFYHCVTRLYMFLGELSKYGWVSPNTYNHGSYYL